MSKQTYVPYILLSLLLSSPVRSQQASDERQPATFTLETSIASQGFDGKSCWVHARAGAIPSTVSGDRAAQTSVVMTLQKLELSGSDVFYGLNQMRSPDLGRSWSEPQVLPGFARQTLTEDNPSITGASRAPNLLQIGDQTTVCDFTPQWHAASQRLLGIGQTVWYRDNRVLHARPRGIAYAVYDAPANAWSPWKTVALPGDSKFESAGAGSVQRVDLAGGDILLPIYFKEPSQEQYSVTVCRCRFDGQSLEYIRHGDELSLPIERGLYEPSLTQFQGQYYLTMRNDRAGYVSTSQDGMHFTPPVPWLFDDDSPLGNYNTQQHWVTHSQGLFLVYTRRGADNDHVFRHRAPLFIARVDPQRMRIIKSTEQIIVPEQGARLGNFGVCPISADETWVTVAEWMQPAGVEKYGSDNRIIIAQLKWHQPNLLAQAAEPQGVPGQTSPQSGLSSNPETPLAWDCLQPYFEPPLAWQDNFGNYRSPLEFADGTRVQSPEEWPARRLEIADQWERYLGEWPPLIVDPQVQVLETLRRGLVTQHRIRFAWTPDQETTAYLLIPEGAGPHPAVLVVYYEPETGIGQGAAYRDFAWQLAQRGFVTLSIGTTEATQAKTYALYYPSLEDARVQPLSMLAYAAANAWHVLANRPEVDAQRIGIVGHSFGGKWAMFAACLFEGFACGAWSDPGIVFDDTRPSVNYWEPWYLGYHSPPWRERGLITVSNPARGLYPSLRAEGRDLHELHALMAPRPFLVSGGSEDPLDRWQALNHSRQVNQVLGFRDRVAMTNRPDHAPNADSNRVIYSFFEHFLKTPEKQSSTLEAGARER